LSAFLFKLLFSLIAPPTVDDFNFYLLASPGTSPGRRRRRVIQPSNKRTTGAYREVSEPQHYKNKQPKQTR
jgi:hypothetical protein